MELINHRKIVVINQASNYLTVGLCNSFAARFKDVKLITGSIHGQGEILNPKIKVVHIIKYKDSHILNKLFAYFIAILKIWWLLFFRYRNHEVFFISLPPMGYLINLFLPHRFSVVIWDVYPDVFRITGMKSSDLLYKFLVFLNKKSFKKTFKLFTISNSMAELLERYTSKDKIIIQPIWSLFQEPISLPKSQNPFITENHLNGKFIVQYSGNIGLTHKVEVLLQLSNLLKDQSNILFLIIGRGPREHIIKEKIEERNLRNCVFLPFQDDDKFPYSLSAADLGVVILDEIVSRGSLPSKLYNLMSYGIPALYIAGTDSELMSYSRIFKNAACFSENNLEQAKRFILQISSNPTMWNEMASNALEAAKKFKRNNADKFIEKYIA
jgi:glycosyltransferase involved in cell wall biosynthesis